MQADQRVVPVSADHALGSIGDHIARRQTGITAFVSLSNVVANTGYAKREADHARLAAPFGDVLGQIEFGDEDEI